MSTRDHELDDVGLADVWRSPDHPRWAEAHERITSIIRKAVLTHAAARRPGVDRPDLVTEIVDGFWVHLADNPATLEASRVHNGGAIQTEVHRFLDRVCTANGDQRGQLRRHLRAKVASGLSNDSRFQGCGRVWQLTAWGTGGSPQSVRSDREVVAILPPLDARLEPQRSDQVPPLVAASVLPDFLVRCLELGGRPRTTWDLTDLVWRCLSPPAESVLGFDDVPAATPEAVAIHGEWRCRIDVLAGDFVDSLPGRMALVMQLFLQGLTARQIAAEHGIARATASADRQKFLKRFQALVEREALDDDQQRQLEGVVRDILEVEPFLEGREE